MTLARPLSGKYSSDAVIVVENLSMSYDGCIIQEQLNFTVNHNDIFIIMGNSGSGKSTLLRAMTGLKQPDQGDIFYACNSYRSGSKPSASGDSQYSYSDSEQKSRAPEASSRHTDEKDKYESHSDYQSYWQSPNAIKHKIMQQFGVMFQNGALFSSMTLLENVSLRLSETTKYSAMRIRKIASLKLALVGLKGFEYYYPAQISGGMQKRVSIARAMVMDPPILFFDEPSAGLDPVSSRLLDDLLLELRDSMGITMIIVTHELDSIFSIANNSIFLDHEQQTIIASGDPHSLLQENTHPHVQAFLSRGKELPGDFLQMKN
ncbi:MAG: ATP-binding cassette domain-containing protein [gamma proteobacterium symbiont of Taylorina sp.]|nr:ATP-binding cassette domain-containing protein [gamma proteobacterium symbiont of Taylorina sp.]